MPGTLHLIPVGLGDAPIDAWLPADVRALAARLDTYIVENAKTARAFLKLIGTQQPLQAITLHTLNDRVTNADIRRWLGPLQNPLQSSSDIGLVSEAGCPAVADPGAQVVAIAHQLGITVKPWVGPSSLLLALMASGLDGQRFAFHGYAPVAPPERAQQLRAWEQASKRHHQTQLLIETPYRNAALFATLLATLKDSTRLCVARALTTDAEYIRTRTIAQWRQAPAPDLAKIPAIFLFLAS